MFAAASQDLRGPSNVSFVNEVYPVFFMSADTLEDVPPEALDYYLDELDRTLETSESERRRRLEEMLSVDRLAVESIVSGYYRAANKHAYLRSLAMILVKRSSLL